MRYLCTFSGGKDSLDTWIWCKNNLHRDQYDVVFCDTEWEDELTYQHIAEIEKQMDKKVIVLKHEPYNISEKNRNIIRSIFGKDNIFAEMIVYHSRFPSTKARFCTEDLKTKPMIDHILLTTGDITVIQGVRSDESASRALLKKEDDYFKFYFEPYRIDKNGKKLFHTYRKADVFKHCDNYATDVFRPILDKTALEVFESIYTNDFKPNPLYKKGMSRVGCFPCVMCRQDEVASVAAIRPLRIIQIAKLEELTNSTFFPPDYIPNKFCTKVANVKLYVDDLLNTNKKNLYNPRLYKSIMQSDLIEKITDEDGDVYVIKKMKVPTVNDVVKYVSDNPNQTRLFEPLTGCVSVYNICETNG